MKQLLFLLLNCFHLLAATAQPSMANDQQRKEDKVYRQVLTNYFKRQFDTSVLVGPKTLYLTSPKPGVHRLPQDNMPCLVPDPAATVAIPNLWKGETRIPFRATAPQMPNPIKRFRISPARPLLIVPQSDADTK